MLYARNEDLPTEVRSVLPVHAQNVYREAFNHAWAGPPDDADPLDAATRLMAAQKAGWAAVERTYVKVAGHEMWQERDYRIGEAHQP